jgi:hypothetical protein
MSRPCGQRLERFKAVHIEHIGRVCYTFSANYAGTFSAYIRRMTMRFGCLNNTRIAAFSGGKRGTF